MIARGVELVQQGVAGQTAARVAFLEFTNHLPIELQAELWDILGGGQSAYQGIA